ncbi:hypothetical protein [Flavobacterium pallidum]|uniref:T9SS C-terminal target domain-containing protein n=1 Tax=Flavobacterium pallidum TaxID=2172098 RepID=A0A2S1SK95_9FLAO|nr:hypothetical protein [Flavobacterium pallidum]AWI26747.1 hypothetical protein HYN49_13060 [Flavobacterium pallidum]
MKKITKKGNGLLCVAFVLSAFLSSSIATAAQSGIKVSNSVHTANRYAPTLTTDSLNSVNVTDTTEVEKHRIWLTLEADNLVTTILVGYVPGATLGVDAGYDCVNFWNPDSAFYSLIYGDAYLIQGRPLPFTTDDVVPLGFKALQAGNLIISVIDADGIFSEGQEILLRDKLNGTTSSINNTPYNFTSDSGTFNDRFEIVYTNANLAISTFGIAKDVRVYAKEGKVFVQSPENIDTVRIFDLQGRLLSERSDVNGPYYQTEELEAGRQLLIVQVADKQGHTIVKKIMN